MNWFELYAADLWLLQNGVSSFSGLYRNRTSHQYRKNDISSDRWPEDRLQVNDCETGGDSEGASRFRPGGIYPVVPGRRIGS